MCVCTCVCVVGLVYIYLFITIIIIIFWTFWKLLEIYYKSTNLFFIFWLTLLKGVQISQLNSFSYVPIPSQLYIQIYGASIIVK